MIHVIASLQIKEGHVAQFIEIFKANVPNVLKEQGCIAYAPTIDIAAGLAAQALDPKLVTIVEQWNSLDDLRAHLAAPHMLAYGERVKDIVVGKSLKILQNA
ncbi:MAG: quinol monooxygenase [Proteobacteria bacterium]|nr:quinol monooxygenase [Pseudomonadota bacterium]